MGLPQGSLLLPVLFNVYTKGLSDLNQNGPSKILTLADNGLTYKTSKDPQEAAETVQQQLDSVSKWCHDTGSLINPDKAQTLWCKQSSRQTNASSHIWWSCGWTNKSSEIPWDPIWQNADLQKTCRNNSTEVQERSVSSESYGCKGYWTMPPLLTVSKCGAQCHQLQTRPHNKSAKAGQSAERGNASHTQNHQGHTHWDCEVHARPPTSANQTESGAGQSILQCCWKSPQPTPRSCKTQMGQAEDSILQVSQLTELKQTKKWERYPNRFRNLYETLLPENLGKHCREWPAAKKSQRSSFSFKKTANCKMS